MCVCDGRRGVKQSGDAGMKQNCENGAKKGGGSKEGLREKRKRMKRKGVDIASFFFNPKRNC